ncbi:MAG TPA: PilZ domain-containing protein [Sphingomicrobium sp.]|nr:PilZ domain-containing protein [Sphingomicrobium sp.]
MALPAQISTYTQPREGRLAGRRTLRLQVSASASGSGAAALIHNLSERGLLLETSAFVEAGDMLVVKLPEAGAIAAEVIWVRDGIAGCRFERPLTTAAVSAALLRSEPRPQPTPAVSELPAATSEWLYDVSDHTDKEPWTGPLAIGALMLALLVASIFIFALLRFPFSVAG